MTVEVVNTGSPFEVTSQAESDLSWSSESTEIITWNVAGTTSNGINADAVDILLSIDGGENFDINLASDISNSGSAEITVPDISSASCRIMVKGKNHIFYALNSTPFSINYLVQTECYTYNSDENLNLDIPDGAGQNQFGDYLVQYFDINEDIVISDIDFNIDITHGYIGDLNIVLQHPDGTQAVLLDSEYCDDENNLDITFNDQASGDIVCSNPTLGNYRPSGTPLSNFNGKSSLGTWVLGVRDYYNEDAGVLNDFSLIFCETELILSNSNIDLDQVLIYPNPVEETLYIDSSREDLIYTLFDLNGREIFNTYKKAISMSRLSNGVYILKIGSHNQSIYKRVVKK